MVMPLGDLHPTRIVPLVNYAIIGACVAMFVVQASRPESFTVAFAATPFEITNNVDLDEPVSMERQVEVMDGSGEVRVVRSQDEIPQAAVPFPVWMTLLTSIFMHGGIMHLAGNMLYLWIFGDNVEEVLGHWRYLLIYVLCGLVASFSQIAIDPGSMVPTLGASGAIAGVMGMYLVWFPRNRVRVLVGRVITLMPAVLVIGIWLLLQLALGLGELDGGGGGVAYAAHVGGAMAGIFIGLFFRARAERHAERPSELGWAPARYRQPARS